MFQPGGFGGGLNQGLISRLKILSGKVSDDFFLTPSAAVSNVPLSHS